MGRHTKQSHAAYLASDHWQKTRKEFLKMQTECERCEMPRWLAKIAYDQDLNVHHKTYSNCGHEKPSDLEALCRRCHDIETFGRSDLREPKSATCTACQYKHWDPYSSLCTECAFIQGYSKWMGGALEAPQAAGPSKGDPVWKGVIRTICNLLSCGDSGSLYVRGELKTIDAEYKAQQKRAKTKGELLG